MQCEKSEYAPQGEDIVDIVDEFADDHDIWTRDFLDAWVIMMNNGASNLVDAPENSWLGHYTIKGISIRVSIEKIKLNILILTL